VPCVRADSVAPPRRSPLYVVCVAPPSASRRGRLVPSAADGRSCADPDASAGRRAPRHGPGDRPRDGDLSGRGLLALARLRPSSRGGVRRRGAVPFSGAGPPVGTKNRTASQTRAPEAPLRHSLGPTPPHARAPGRLCRRGGGPRRTGRTPSPPQRGAPVPPSTGSAESHGPPAPAPKQPATTIIKSTIRVPAARTPRSRRRIS
jgi:hypothetical protein